MKDTILIREVVITGNTLKSDPSGYKKTIIDSSVLVNYSASSLSELLSANTGIFIKSYGMGGTATPAFRGTGAGHTLIDWNGININNPMLGQSDLSLIPVGLIDDIQIFFGGASMSLNNGGTGGTINLETKPVWKKETLVLLNAGTGSFGRYSGLIKVKTGNYKFQTVTKAFFHNAENNFRYRNTEISSEPVWQTRTDNQVRQRGFIEELYFRNAKHVTSARIWYQSSERNLPASMLTLQPKTSERQFDESIRTMLNYDVFKGRSAVSLTGAWMLNRLNYFNRLASIDSRNLSGILTLKAGFETQAGENTKIKIVVDDQSGHVKSNNYDQTTTRNTASLTASIDRKKGRFGTMLLMREILDKGSLLIPDFSAALQFRLIDEKEYYLKTNFSRNSKLPTMNELYWLPGGNPDLRNEFAYMYEINYEMNQKITLPLSFKYDLSLFRYNIKDMIQWHPGEYAYWTADNIQSVSSTGLESTVVLDYVLNKLNAGLNGGYSMTRAVAGGTGIKDDVSVGKQLMYIPEHQVNVSLNIGFGYFYSSWVTDFTGKRYITVDNSRYLPGYIISNFITGIKLPVKNVFIDMNFTVDNLFNKDYQSIAFYPLPGRSYFLKILVKLIK